MPLERPKINALSERFGLEGGFLVPSEEGEINMLSEGLVSAAAFYC